jgi:hypothetical protein
MILGGLLDIDHTANDERRVCPTRINKRIQFRGHAWKRKDDAAVDSHVLGVGCVDAELAQGIVNRPTIPIPPAGTVTSTISRRVIF